jgi:Ca2+-binding RTX toxin-like protein
VNGGGFHVSANYGFGLVDARAAVRLAETWDAQQTSANEQVRTAAFTGPLVLDNANTARELLLPIAPGVRAEQVTLALDIGGMMAQDLEIELISPRGTASMLFFHSGGPAPGGQPVAFRPWTFVSNAFFGEDAAGTWRLLLRDTYANGSTGTINGAVLSVFGDAAGPDDRYVYTDEFGAVAGMAHGAVLADAGGEDTIDASAASTASVIELRAGTAGQVAGAPLLVAPGILIEHAIGGDGHDRLVGNAAANRLRGGRGDDVLLGLGGDDTLEGGAGRDSLDGGPGRDVLLGGAGIDVLRGRGGDDTLEGGAGDDWLEGGAGADTLRGGPGLDALSYAGSPAGVSVALGVLGPGGRQAASGGDAEGDLAYGFEHLVGSRHADTLAGDGRRNHIRGNGGGDALSGGADDAFVFIGGAAFTAPGQLRAWFDGADTVIEGNTAGGAEPELRIRLAGELVLGVGDFGL